MVLAIYGSGGAGKEIREIADSCNRWSEILFVDDTVLKDTFKGSRRMPFTELEQEYGLSDIEFLIALGEPKYKKALYDKVKKRGYQFATLLHPDAYVSPDAKIGRGVIVQKGAYISPDTLIGDNVTIEQNVVVSHDTKIGEHCQISAFTILAGKCEVGRETFIGISSSVRECIKIGEHSIVGMGSVVVNNIPDASVAYGNPAKIVRSDACDSTVFN